MGGIIRDHWASEFLKTLLHLQGDRQAKKKGIILFHYQVSLQELPDAVVVCPSCAVHARVQVQHCFNNDGPDRRPARAAGSVPISRNGKRLAGWVRGAAADEGRHALSPSRE
jgi:hypothetical protein